MSHFADTASKRATGFFERSGLRILRLIARNVDLLAKAWAAREEARVMGPSWPFPKLHCLKLGYRTSHRTLCLTQGEGRMWPERASVSPKGRRRLAGRRLSSWILPAGVAVCAVVAGAVAFSSQESAPVAMLPPVLYVLNATTLHESATSDEFELTFWVLMNGLTTNDTQFYMGPKSDGYFTVELRDSSGALLATFNSSGSSWTGYGGTSFASNASTFGGWTPSAATPLKENDTLLVTCPTTFPTDGIDVGMTVGPDGPEEVGGTAL